MKLFRKLFWVSIGAGLGVYGYAKFRAYARAHTPRPVAHFAFGPELSDQDAMTSTLTNLRTEFEQAQAQREQELTDRFTHREQEFGQSHRSEM